LCATFQQFQCSQTVRDRWAERECAERAHFALPYAGGVLASDPGSARLAIGVHSRVRIQATATSRLEGGSCQVRRGVCPQHASECQARVSGLCPIRRCTRVAAAAWPRACGRDAAGPAGESSRVPRVPHRSCPPLPALAETPRQAGWPTEVAGRLARARSGRWPPVPASCQRGQGRRRVRRPGARTQTTRQVLIPVSGDGQTGGGRTARRAYAATARSHRHSALALVARVRGALTPACRQPVDRSREAAARARWTGSHEMRLKCPLKWYIKSYHFAATVTLLTKRY
jgi:hypothetical protein